MKRITLTALAVLLLAPQALSQLAPVWSRNYDSPGQEQQRVKSLLAVPGGGVVSIQISQDSSGGQRTVVAAKFSANGELLWEVARPTAAGLGVWYGGNANGAIDAAGNLYLVYGDLPVGHLLKIDPQGGLLWDTPISATTLDTSLTNHLVLDSGGLPIVIGTVDRQTWPHIALYKYSANGAQLWAQGGTVEGAVTDVAIGPANEIVVFGRHDWFFAGSAFYGTVARFHADGSPDWNLRHSSDGYGTLCCGTFWGDHVQDGFIDDQGNIYAISNGSFGSEWFQDGYAGFALGRWDSNGVQAYRATISSPRNMFGLQMTVDASRNVYVVGYETMTDFGNDRGLALWQVDANGVPGWKQNFIANDVDTSFGSGLEVTAAGNIVVTGNHDGTPKRGVDVAFSPAGVELWRVERPGQSAAFSNDPTDRGSVLLDSKGHIYTHTSSGDASGLNKLIPGGLVGTNYCGPAVSNSTGGPGSIEALGQQTAALDNLTLRLSNLPSGMIALLLGSQTAGLTPMLGGGAGTLCIAGALGRFNAPEQVRVIGADGTSTLQLALDALPTPNGPTMALMGQTWFFQAWYRDLNPGPTSNLTDAVAVLFQ